MAAHQFTDETSQTDAHRVLEDITNSRSPGAIVEHYSQASIERSIESCTDPELLAKVRKSLWGTEHEYLRSVADFHRQQVERVGRNYDFNYQYNSFGTFTDTEIDFTAWKEVYSTLTPSELVDAAVVTQANKNIDSPELYRILKGFAFLKTNNETHLIDAFNLNNRGDGLSKEQQANRIGKTLQEIHPVIAGLLCGYIRKVTTNKTDSSNPYGSAKDESRWLNLLSDTRAGGTSTVAHEIGHAIQYAYNSYCRSSIDNRDADTPSEADYSVSTDYAGYATQFQEDIEYLWDKFQTNDIECVRPYQEKNFNEFFACAFENWATDDVVTPIEYTSFFTKYFQRLEPYY